jgi:hypothetical protein
MGNRQKHRLLEKNRGRELRKTEPDCKKPRKIGHSCMLRGLGLRTAHKHPPPIFNWINAAIPPGRKSHSSDPPASTDSPWSSNPAPVVSPAGTPADIYVKADHGMTPGRKGNALQSREGRDKVSGTEFGHIDGRAIFGSRHLFLLLTPFSSRDRSRRGRRTGPRHTRGPRALDDGVIAPSVTLPGFTGDAQEGRRR